MIFNKKRYFYFIMSIFVILVIISSNYTNGKSVTRIFVSDPNDTYMDFYNCLMYQDKPYENKVIYPPLPNLFYYIVSENIPRTTFSKGSFAIRNSQMGRFIGGIYIILSMLLFIYIVLKIKQGTIEEKMILLLLLILSGPFIFQFERGNIIFLALIFILFFLYGYDSKNTIIKHLSFISLSIAASLKIYPTIFGFILLREKRWKDAAICICYGISIFILPIVYLGGFSKFPLFINNLLDTSKLVTTTFPTGIQLSIQNFFKVIAQYSKIELFQNLGGIATILVLITGFIIILFGDFKQKWKLYTVPTLLMITIPSISFIYAMIFISIPLIYFLDEQESDKLDKFYLTLFILCLSPIPIHRIGYAYSVFLFFMIVLIWYEGLKSIFMKYKYKSL